MEPDFYHLTTLLGSGGVALVGIITKKIWEGVGIQKMILLRIEDLSNKFQVESERLSATQALTLKNDMELAQIQGRLNRLEAGGCHKYAEHRLIIGRLDAELARADREATHDKS